MPRNHRRIRKGVYAPDDLSPWEVYEQLCRAVLAAVSDRAVLTGPAAAFARGLPLVGEPPATVHLRGLLRGRYGRDVHVVSADAGSAQLHGGWPVTDPETMLLDCCRYLSARDALIVADAAAHAGLVSGASLAAAAGRWRGVQGVRTLRRIVAGVDPACESPGETWTRMVLTELGYAVRSQVVVRDGDFAARLDFLIEGSRVVVEFDGAMKYEHPAAFQSEKNRQARLEALGYRLIRVTWEQLADPVALDRRIRWALRSS